MQLSERNAASGRSATWQEGGFLSDCGDPGRFFRDGFIYKEPGRIYTPGGRAAEIENKDRIDLQKSVPFSGKGEGSKFWYDTEGARLVSALLLLFFCFSIDVLCGGEWTGKCLYTIICDFLQPLSRFFAVL